MIDYARREGSEPTYEGLKPLIREDGTQAVFPRSEPTYEGLKLQLGLGASLSGWFVPSLPMRD